MKKITIIIFITFYLLGCGSYSELKQYGEAEYIYLFDLIDEDIVSVKYYITRKEYREISKMLNKKYGKGKLSFIKYLKSKDIYYCEFKEDVRGIIIHVLLLDKKLKIIAEREMEFDT